MKQLLFARKKGGGGSGGEEAGGGDVPGVATHIAFITQPAGAVDDSPFTTQPVLEVRDAFGDRVTDATNEVTISIASGSGAIVGDVIVSAVAGVVTFVDVEINGTGSHTLSAAATGLTGATSASFNVSAAGSLHWFADWAGATGESTAAVTDGGKFTSAIGNTDDRVTVIPDAPSYGFPANMANCLRIRGRTSAAVGLLADNIIPVPAVGEHTYWRIYVLQNLPASDPSAPSDPSAHPVLCRPATSIWGLLHNLGATFQWTQAVNNNADDNHHRFSFTASPNVVYLIEWHIHRLTETTVTFEQRVSVENAEGVWELIFDEDDLTCTSGHLGPHTMGSSNPITIDAASDFDGIAGMTISHEGANHGPFPDDNQNYLLYGAPAVSLTGWIGPY